MKLQNILNFFSLMNHIEINNIQETFSKIHQEVNHTSLIDYVLTSNSLQSTCNIIVRKKEDLKFHSGHFPLSITILKGNNFKNSSTNNNFHVEKPKIFISYNQSKIKKINWFDQFLTDKISISNDIFTYEQFLYYFNHLLIENNCIVVKNQTQRQKNKIRILI